MSKHNKEHGTTRSYVVGYILSLIFTFIPYYAVVNKWLTGNALLATILGIGVLQMVIQLVFFLHLGRGPKPLYNVVFFFATAGVIVLTVGASLFIMANLYHNMSPEEVTKRIAQDEAISQVDGHQTGACKDQNQNHVVTVNEVSVTPVRINAKLCDTLTFVDASGHGIKLGFGKDGKPESYGGIFDVETSENHPEILSLNQVGEFTFYNKNFPIVVGELSVTESE